ncbi:hypothetical protein GH733_006594, partial [Mirounga leonina]
MEEWIAEMDQQSMDAHGKLLQSSRHLLYHPLCHLSEHGLKEEKGQLKYLLQEQNLLKWDKYKIFRGYWEFLFSIKCYLRKGKEIKSDTYPLHPLSSCLTRNVERKEDGAQSPTKPTLSPTLPSHKVARLETLYSSSSGAAAK